MANVESITFNIFADTPEEAQLGRKAIVHFINLMGKYGAKVSGKKLDEAVSKLNDNQFILNQIINFFKK